MRFFTPLVFAALLFVTGPQSRAQSTSHTGEFQQLTFTISTPKMKYAEFEPIPIVLSLKNETDELLMGHVALAFSMRFIKLYVDNGEGPQEVRYLAAFISDVYVNPRPFKPGEEVKQAEHLNLRLNDLFPQPGTYRLHARLASVDGAESVLSKPITVEIVSPQGIDAGALNYLRTQANPALFFSGMNLFEKSEQQQVLANFVAQYSESVYGDEATLTFAHLLFALREYEQARVIYEKLVKKPDYVFAEEATRYLGMIRRRTQTP